MTLQRKQTPQVRYWADLKHKQSLWVLTLCSPVITPSPSAQPMGPAQGPSPWVQPMGPAQLFQYASCSNAEFPHHRETISERY